MKRIAQEAGVSIMTVSRVMNGTGKVASATASRIQAIADRMNYRTNRLVRGMQTGRTGLIGVVMPAGLGFYAGVLEGIHDHFAEGDASILLSLVHGNWGENAIAEERKILHRLVELRVDGIILCPVNDDATPLYFEEILKRRVPIVVVDRQLPNFPCDFVGTDDTAGGKEAAARLLDRGAKNLLLVTAGDSLSPSRDRAEGFKMAMADRNGTASLQVLECPDFSPNEERIREFLSADAGKVDGIFAVNDHLALGCLRGLRSLDRHVPDDVALIGFGAIGTGNGYFIPVSTFDQHAKQIGTTASEMLEARIGKKTGGAHAPPRAVRLTSTFVDRGT